jgi:hypothetical protein
MRARAARSPTKSGEPGRVQVSATTRDILQRTGDAFVMKDRGEIEVKGIGMMRTYWLVGRQNGALRHSQTLLRRISRTASAIASKSVLPAALPRTSSDAAGFDAGRPVCIERTVSEPVVGSPRRDRAHTVCGMFAGEASPIVANGPTPRARRPTQQPELPQSPRLGASPRYGSPRTPRTPHAVEP